MVTYTYRRQVEDLQVVVATSPVDKINRIKTPERRRDHRRNGLHKTALKRSSLGLDLYLWLVYRTFVLRAPQRITWRQVYRQFGVDPARASDRVTVRNFQRKVLSELKKSSWPGRV